jgi:hypothetical protein
LISAVVTDGSELTQERIDEIIKIGEMAEREGIEPGYLISSQFFTSELFYRFPFVMIESNM